MLHWACDILPMFILKSDLTFAENILLNYLLITEDKAKAIWMSMNFVSRSAAQRALQSLTTKYKLVSIDNEGKVTQRIEFKQYTMNIHINNSTWRPKKLAKANMK